MEKCAAYFDEVYHVVKLRAFEIFDGNLELNLDTLTYNNPFLNVTTVDFN